MLGYITPNKPELKIRDYELYSAYYCGICKSIGKRYGQLPRMTLNYDSVFLALILAGLEETPEDIRLKRCPVHPLRKKPMLYGNKAVDYAADMHLILSYYKLKDDYMDDKNLLAGAAAFFAGNIFHKLSKKYPDKSEIIETKLQELSKIEKYRTASLDESAEPFAGIMETVFTWTAESEDPNTIGTYKILGRIGYHIGKWIYIIDAFDDIEKNSIDNAYNPIIAQFNFDSKSDESISDFKGRVKERIEFNLLSYLEELSKSYDLLSIKKNKMLIENIIYLGLLTKTEEVLAKGSKKQNGKSL